MILKLKRFYRQIKLDSENDREENIKMFVFYCRIQLASDVKLLCNQMSGNIAHCERLPD